MAKSKQQKQEEALMRKRQNYNNQLERWRDWAPTGKYFADHVKHYGVEAAEKRKAQADTVWCKYLKEAKLDIYGNAVSHAEVRRPGIHRHSFDLPDLSGDKGVVVTIRDPSKREIVCRPHLDDSVIATIEKSGILFEPYTL